MILTRKHLRKIVRRGGGWESGICRADGCDWVIVNRADVVTPGQSIGRTDHYIATDADIQRLEKCDHCSQRIESAYAEEE